MSNKPTIFRYLRPVVVGTVAALGGCGPQIRDNPVVPSLEYAQGLGGGLNAGQQHIPLNRHQRYQEQAKGRTADMRARVRFAADGSSAPEGEYLSNLNAAGEPSYEVHESTQGNRRDYNGPLALGDPGLSASLFQENRTSNGDLFHDVRAWQPMDLVTIIVTETAEGRKEADTNVKQESSYKAALENFFGFENDVLRHNKNDDGSPRVDLSNLINAQAESEFKGEGDTSRRDSLRARISAMVVEVLPSGILRIEGEKILSVNNEEQIMVISGLVRPRDVTSANDVDSSKIANMRIDYFGRGAVSSAQYGGWLSNLLRILWPF